MPDEQPLAVDRTYSKTDSSWQNAFAEPDDRPAHLLRQDALSELDKPESPAYLAMKMNFKQIDKNGDGFLDPNEIAQEAENDRDLAGLAGDRQAQWNMKKLAHDGRNDSRGITMKDVDAYGMQVLAAQQVKQLKLASEFLDTYFNKIDRGSDGLISRDDLGQLTADPSLKFHFRQKFLLVERHFDTISEQSREKVFKFKEHEGISQKDLKVLIRNNGYFLR